MKLTRRKFFQATVAGAAVAVACDAAPSAISAPVREEKKLSPGAVGFLFDSTLCVGCKACVAACREANQTPAEFDAEDKLWDSPLDLSARTFTVIKAYSEGSAEHKDQERDGYAFIKKSCLHCVDPSCASVCPVSAMTKDPKTGIVVYNPANCIGCRYCVAACPFGVPRFEYDKTFARLGKCEMCKQRRAAGKIPACAEVCPTGATLYGPVIELRAEASRRHRLTPGERTLFPRKFLSSGDKHEKPAPRYVDETYGSTEVGGTQVQFLAGVSFQKLGLPALPARSFVSTSEKIQHTIYKGMIAPALLFGGLLFLVRRNASRDEKKGR